MTGNAVPLHPRLTPRQTPDADLIQTFLAKNGVTKPTTAQERRAARKEARERGLLTASDPVAYRFRPGTDSYTHRSIRENTQSHRRQHDTPSVGGLR
jgi:hypothetical protein